MSGLLGSVNLLVLRVFLFQCSKAITFLWGDILICGLIGLVGLMEYYFCIIVHCLVSVENGVNVGALFWIFINISSFV